MAHLILEVLRPIPAEKRTKEVHVLCTDTRVEIPAVVGIIEGTLNKMQRFSDTEGLRVQTHLLRPPAEQSFRGSIIGRGHPPPNRVLRWCTQRMKIDPFNVFIERQLGREGEAILHLGARRAESSTRAQAMAGHEVRNGLRRHPDLCRVYVSNPIEHLATEKVWAFCSSIPHRGAARIATFIVSTTTPAAANARYKSIPARPAAVTPASVAGPVRWSSATRPAKACWPAATSGWSRSSRFANACSSFRTPPTDTATPCA